MTPTCRGIPIPEGVTREEAADLLNAVPPAILDPFARAYNPFRAHAYLENAARIWRDLREKGVMVGDEMVRSSWK